MSLHADPRAPGLHVGAEVTIAEDVELGANVTIHNGTVVGAGCVLEDGVVLGKRPRLARHSSAQHDIPAALVLAERVTVCAGAIVFAGAGGHDVDAQEGRRLIIKQGGVTEPAASRDEEVPGIDAVAGGLPPGCQPRCDDRVISR